MDKCNGYCDGCVRDLCVYGNPTLEPDPDELNELMDEVILSLNNAIEACQQASIAAGKE